MEMLVFGLWAVTIIVALAGGPAMAQQKITGIDLLTDFRELSGQMVIVTDCVITGTTSDFIQCEVPNRAGSYVLDSATMIKNDLRWIYTNCPGGLRKADCEIAVKGVVEKNPLPRLTNVKIIR
jgi:hypothetical protein